MEKISKTCQELFQQIGIENAVTVQVLRSKWDTIFPGSICQHTSPFLIKEGNLIIHVDSPEWLHELQFHAESIKERLRDFRIKKIRLKLGRIQHAPSAPLTQEEKKPLTKEDIEFIEDTIGSINDEDLRRKIKKAIENSIAHDKK